MPDSIDDPEAHRFDAEDVVWRYRFAYDTDDRACVALLRKKWADGVGEDSLHEPIEPAAFAERLKRTNRESLRVMKRLETIEAEIAWLERVMKGDDCGRTIADQPRTVWPCGTPKAA